VKEIVLTTINAKWIHPSLALRLLKANLGSDLIDSCEILEFALRQPLAEKLESIRAANPLILGVSVSIWNHQATIELLKSLEIKPIVVLGGPEVSFLPEDSEIFLYAEYIIRGEGETAFRLLCEKLLAGEKEVNKFINAENTDICKIKTAYHLYTDEDIAKKLIYVESSRGCVFNCEFCLSAVKTSGMHCIREFPLEPFFAEMDILIKRGVRTFKFLDRSFNINIKRSIQIIEFFVKKINSFLKPSSSLASSASLRLGEEFSSNYSSSLFTVHFEMVPSLFPSELLEALSRFPPDTLRLEIGIQTLNREAAARIGRLTDPKKELETLHYLSEKTNAIIHADLIAGLPGEDIESFGRGFDQLWSALGNRNAEIQLGILKLLPGAPIKRHSEKYGMQYNPLPPYEIIETSMMNVDELKRIKNFARFWDIIIGKNLIEFNKDEPVFDKFMKLSDDLFAHFGKNWGIDRAELLKIAVKTSI